MAGPSGFFAGGLAQGMGQGRQFVLEIAHQKLLEKQEAMMEKFRQAQEEWLQERGRHEQEQDVLAPFKFGASTNPELIPAYTKALSTYRGEPYQPEHAEPIPGGGPGLDITAPPPVSGFKGLTALAEDVASQIRSRRLQDVRASAENKLNIQTAGKEQDYNKALMQELLRLQRAMMSGQLKITDKSSELAVRKQLDLYMKIIASGVPIGPEQYAQMSSGIDQIASRYGIGGTIQIPGIPPSPLGLGGEMPPPPPGIPSKPAATETEHIRAIRDALSHSKSLVKMIEQGKLPGYTTAGSGWLGSKLNQMGQVIGTDNPQVSEFRKWLTQNFLGRLRAIGGARAVNKFDIQNLISSFENPNVNPATLEALARGSVATLQKELDDAMNIYRSQGKNIPDLPEEFISPEGILGKRPMPPGGVKIPQITPPR
jgi:hypothetical protein